MIAPTFPWDFASKFAVYVQEKRREDSTESVNDLKSRFAIMHVPHLHNKPLIQVTLWPAIISRTMSVTIYLTWPGLRDEESICTMLIRKEATTGSVLGILADAHKHQRYFNDSYDANGMLKEVNTLIDFCEQLQDAGVTNAELLKLFESGLLLQRFMVSNFNLFSTNVAFQATFRQAHQLHQKTSDLYVEHVKSQMGRGKYQVYIKLHCSVIEKSSLRQRAESTRYVSQIGQTAAERNYYNNPHEIGVRLVRFCSTGNIPTIDAYSNIPEDWAKWIETPTLDGYHRDESYRLANKSLGKNELFAVDEVTDRMLAAFLFVYGLLKSNGWRIEALTCIDYKTLYEEQKDALIEQQDVLLAELQAQIQELSVELLAKSS